MDLKFLVAIVVGLLIFTSHIVCGRKIIGEEMKIIGYGEATNKSCDSKTSVSCGVRPIIPGGKIKRSGKAMPKASTNVSMGDDTGSTNEEPIIGIKKNKMPINSRYNISLGVVFNTNGQYSSQMPNNGMQNNH